MNTCIINVLFILSVYAYFCSGTVSCSRQTDSEPFIDPRDGKLYKTVKIGDQVWMAENLNYDVGLGCCSYKLDSFAFKKYGRLYRWEAAKRAVPPGWHLPSKEEFEILLNNLGGEGSLAYQQMISGGSSGFNAVFNGIRQFSGYLANSYVDEMTAFWSSTENHNYTAWFVSLGSGSKSVNMDYGNQNNGLSVRLIKNPDDQTFSAQKKRTFSKAISRTFTDPRDGKVYKTVRIGNQVWMGQNLNFDVGDNCYDYDNNPANGEKYGKLYTWKAAKRAVPPGWHLPSNQEFDELIDYLGILKRAYSELTSAEGYKFNAVFGGHSYGKDFFRGIEEQAYFWCSFEGKDEHAGYLLLDKQRKNFEINTSNGLGLISIRLIKDKENINEQNLSDYHKSSGAGENTYTDPRDGKVYKTVTIGTQIWMAENLNYELEYNRGTGFCYDNDTANCREYGRLYDYDATRSVFPPGWHIPGKNEFETLLKNIGGESGDAYMNIITGGSSGFNAKFGGLRIDKTYRTSVTYKDLGKDAYFWSSTGMWQYMWKLNVNSDKHSVSLNNDNSAGLLLSIRLIKD